MSVSSSSAMVVAGSQVAPLGTLRLPSFVSTFLPVPAISGSNSACLMDSFPSTRASSSLGGGLPFVPPSMSPEKAFVVGPGHAPIPAKMVSKIISGQFVDLADLLSANLRTMDQEPHTFFGRQVAGVSKTSVSGNFGYSDLDGSFHNLSDGVVHSSPSSMARSHKVQIIDHPNSSSFTRSGVSGI